MPKGNDIKKSTSKGSLAEDKKLKKYQHLNNDNYLVPVAIETTENLV